MGMAKRELQEHEDRIVAIEAIAIEVKAIIHDGDNDETSSAEDPDDVRAHRYERPASSGKVGKSDV